MKKLLVLMLVFSVASLASATVIDVVLDGAGSNGHAGTVADPLDDGETIMVKILLQGNPVSTGWTSYDGYGLSSFDLALSSDVGTVGYGRNAMDTGDATALSYEASVSPNSDTLATGAFSQITGVSTATVQAFGAIPGADLVWNIKVTAAADASLLNNIDLSINGLSQYTDNIHNGIPYNSSWTSALDSDLGDLAISVVPEPMTMALLGLGGLFLRRRK